MKKIIFLFIAIVSLSLYAHEGHDHGPGQVQPVKGGVIMKADHFFLEVVGTQAEIKIYPFEQKKENALLTPLSLKNIKVKASYKLPRGKESKSITLIENGDHFVGKVDAKTHRYQVDTLIEHDGEKEQFTYQIEPQD